MSTLGHRYGLSPAVAQPHRMARELMRRAVQVIPLLPAIDRVAAVDALSHYAQAPSASRYLRAWRLLQETGRSARASRFSSAAVDSDFAHQMDTLAASPSMNAAWAELWREHLVVDRKTPDRVRALALLLSSYEHLAGRVLAEQDELAKQLKKSGVRRRKGR